MSRSLAVIHILLVLLPACDMPTWEIVPDAYQRQCPVSYRLIEAPGDGDGWACTPQVAVACPDSLDVGADDVADQHLGVQTNDTDVGCSWPYQVVCGPLPSVDLGLEPGSCCYLLDSFGQSCVDIDP